MLLPSYLTAGFAVRRTCRANDEALALALVKQLSPVEGTMPPPSPQGIIYTSCNDPYLNRFVRDLLRSARVRSPKQHFHLHLYDPGPDSVPSLQEQFGRQNLTVSWEHREKADAPIAMVGGDYYVSVRFVRMWQLLKASRSPLFAIDADAIVRNDLTSGFASQAKEDIALFLRRKRRNPLRKVLGAAVMTRPTELGLRFIRDCAAVFVPYLQKGGWEAIDQLILYLVWRWYDIHVPGFRCGELTKSYSDWSYLDDSFVWHAKGSRKDRPIPLDRVFGSDRLS